MSNEEFSYNMKHKKRGKAIIFNHTTFEDNCLGPRKGTEKDAEDLKKILSKLRFDVSIHEDLRVKEIKEIVKNVSKEEEDHTDEDCILIAVLTHGKEGRLYDSEGTDYPQDVLWDPFRADNCVTLAEKPKIFIIQACRGDKMDQGLEVRRGVSTDASRIPPGSPFQKIPNFADFLIFRSTTAGYVAWRKGDGSGSWLIQSLCKVLESTLGKGDFSKDLLTLFTRASQRVSHEMSNSMDMACDGMKQIPEVCSTLTKDIYFN